MGAGLVSIMAANAACERVHKPVVRRSAGLLCLRGWVGRDGSVTCRCGVANGIRTRDDCCPGL